MKIRNKKTVQYARSIEATFQKIEKIFKLKNPLKFTSKRSVEAVIFLILLCLRGGDVDFLVGDEFGFRLQNLLKQRNVETVLLVGEQKNRAGDEQDRYDGADDDPFFQEGWF